MAVPNLTQGRLEREIKQTMEENVFMEYITGNDPNIVHVRTIGNGGFGQVYVVYTLAFDSLIADQCGLGEWRSPSLGTKNHLLQRKPRDSGNHIQ